MAELKPCKCPGNKPTLITHWMEEKIIESYVYCFGCGTSTDKYTSKEQAIDAWNKRV